MINLQEIVIPELAFDAGAVANQEQLFKLIVNRLREFGITTDQDILLEGFKKREELCSTGVGHGVALPHAATSAIDRIVVVVVRLNPGLKWQARDELPVNLIVALVSPPSL
ncbi:MAG: PTS sugar transporter subunit IIA [candidate division WOR-3 bacterium]